MDGFARLPSEERRVYFEQAAAKLGLIVQVVEKDFWICWSPKRLVLLAECLLSVGRRHVRETGKSIQT